MPALKLACIKFHVASDDTPIFAACSAIYHVVWLVVMLATAPRVLDMPEHCHHRGRQYIATVAGLLFCFTVGLLLELLIIAEGCHGAPFEESKRRRMPGLLYARFSNLCAELIMTGYGTYVVFGTDVSCTVDNMVVWNPKREVMALVLLTWSFEVAILLTAWLFYNAWPEHHKADTWESRFLWLGKWLLCQEASAAAEPHRQKSLRRIARWVTRLVGHVDLTPSDVTLALLLVATLQRKRRRDHIITSLAPSSILDEDEAERLELQRAATTPLKLAALRASHHFGHWGPLTSAAAEVPPSRLRSSELRQPLLAGGDGAAGVPKRGDAGRPCKPPAVAGPQDGPAEGGMDAIAEDQPLQLQSPFASLSQRPLKNSPPGSESTLGSDQGSRELVSHALTLESEGSRQGSSQEPGRQRTRDSLEVIMGAAFVQQPSMVPPQQQGSSRPDQEGPATAEPDLDIQPAEGHVFACLMPAVVSPHHQGQPTNMLQAVKDLEGYANPLEKFRRQMSISQTSCLTPSGMDEDFRGELSACDAVQAYTGHHRHIPADQLEQAKRFARFAVAVYGLEPHSHRESRLTNAMQTWARMWRDRRARWGKARPPEGSVHGGASNLLESLNIEAIKQQAQVDDSQLVYVSFANKALAHLPYMVALDPSTRSVVVSVRGTATIEDVITDCLADPVILDRSQWLPQRIQREQQGERMYAHAGIVAAAAAILQDMEATGILARLLTRGQGGGGQAALSRVEDQQPLVAGQDAGGSGAKGHLVGEAMRQQLDCSGWNLVLTGHSLGAGVAVLMALRLLDQFPDLQCWAFGPPGGLMSPNLSRAVEGFVTSCVCGKDIVARLSVVNIGRLLDDMVTSLALCRHNKNAMLMRRMGTYWRHGRPEQLFWGADHVPQEAVRVLEQYAAGVEARARIPEMILPGRVMFLRPIKQDGVRAWWDAVSVSAGEVAREGILVSPRLMEDHYSNTCMAALESAQAHAMARQLPGYVPMQQTSC